ncbi:MAG: two-component sensor histidine kinase [Brevundimonas subvibrioides]|uniref:histidine kinase n=1 Tax=Brevundimonas subvibrioides TaxID=74313 RepID=A0A258HK52_9CAUL|nr:HAMP domain-containing sensor histidine kinase [Brevundimonas subvibrioides]OYX57361.1 MAG: two-component sensor histidine kinase [Brevundimonas subvibrioides]
MNPVSNPAPVASPPPARAVGEGLSALTAWHAAWAVGAALSAVAGAGLGWFGGSAIFGATAMVVPGLAGLALLWRDGTGERSLLLVVWTLAAVAAAMLSGGPAGPLVGYVIMPFVAALALGGPRHGVRLAQAGAIGAGVAALGGQLSALLVGPPGGRPLPASISVVLATAAAVLAVTLAWRLRENKLNAAEAMTLRVETLLAAQPGLTLVLEPSGRVLAAYGSAPPALEPRTLFQSGLFAAVHAPDRPAILAAIDRALAGQEGQAQFAPRMALDRRVNLIIRRMDDGDGGARVIAQAFDATRQFATEIGLEAARAEAEARDTGKTRFLANMSHELRTPLNAVLGFSDIMRQRLFGPLPQKYADYADSIHEAGGHLLDLINDVLDVSKIEAERYELSRESFDAREVVSAAVALVRVTATDKGVGLSSLVPDEPLAVEADRRALKQITLNLLSNAIKFTPAGGSVTLTLEVIGPYLELVVSDTGVGIAAKDLKRLGRPFEQAGAVEQKVQGTGLGLSLVRSLAELHGGRMSLDSTLGEGTAVTVRLPVAVAVRPEAPEGGAEVIPFNAGG